LVIADPTSTALGTVTASCLGVTIFVDNMPTALTVPSVSPTLTYSPDLRARL
jgi:hypothetical protein